MKIKDLCRNCSHFFYLHVGGTCHQNIFVEDGEPEECQCSGFELYEGGEE